ncbi:MAG: hypothetical protein WB791_03305 [Waddliaceae bacterium]
MKEAFLPHFQHGNQPDFPTRCRLVKQYAIYLADQVIQTLVHQRSHRVQLSTSDFWEIASERLTEKIGNFVNFRIPTGWSFKKMWNVGIIACDLKRHINHKMRQMEIVIKPRVERKPLVESENK